MFDLGDVLAAVDGNKDENVDEVTFTKAAREKRESPSVADEARSSLKERMKTWQAGESGQ